MEEEQFPIVDISRFVNSIGGTEQTEPILEETAQDLLKGFSEWGFIYLKGHPIPEDMIEMMFKESEKFFKQPLEEKKKVLMDTSNSEYIIGYVPFMMETFDATKPFDLKEAFDYMHHIRPEMKNNLSSDYLKLFKTFFDQCIELSSLLFKLLTKALKIKDTEYLTNSHRKLGYLGNTTILRSLFYPPVKKEDILPEQGRCGEHSDYGTFTLLFQNANGLEVMSPTGKFIKAKVIPGTIVVNAADLLERWTSGKIKSTIHRVTLPDDTTVPRQSIAYFCNPDNDCFVECLDGSNKYEGVSTYDYIDKRFKETFVAR